MMKVYLFIPILFFFFSCEDENLSQDEVLQEMESISKSIDELVATSCNSADQCKAAAIGAKPCGGPWDYIIYSSDTDEEQLTTLIDRYTALNKKYNELSGIGSDCSVVSPPTLDCVSGNCEEVSE